MIRQILKEREDTWAKDYGFKLYTDEATLDYLETDVVRFMKEQRITDAKEAVEKWYVRVKDGK